MRCFCLESESCARWTEISRSGRGGGRDLQLHHHRVINPNHSLSLGFYCLKLFESEVEVCGCDNSKTAMLMFHCFLCSIPVIALHKTNETALALEHWEFPCFCLYLATFGRASFFPRFISTIAYQKRNETALALEHWRFPCFCLNYF